ncbi:hypothetical protein M0C34_12260 [Agarivorans sp. TSD2052]|uniref:hypothetical protein n=1 Tax=Agarivorans sp. TSD2052 TaxID=2937286 RepID=UPI00200EC81B|nr:hypothetical protein [Agarivorans sp. TSD2052]UPW17020.1 hypothetical protein M0C34_12260 [Agarivorans sp. TSD2052]
MLRSLTFYWPLLSFAIILAALSSYLGSIDKPNCNVFFGYSASIWSLIMFCFGFPLLLAVGSAYSFYAGCYSLKQGIYPPTNVPSLGIKVQTGWTAKLRALVALLFPILAVAIIVLGIHTFDDVLGSQSLPTLQMKLAGKCS